MCARRAFAHLPPQRAGTAAGPSTPVEFSSPDPELLEDVLEGPARYLMSVMARDRRPATVGRVQPYLMAMSLTVKSHAKPAQSSLQLAVGHGSAIGTSTRIVPSESGHTSRNSLGRGSPCSIRDAMDISTTS